ncbi:MAG: hypothetical protein JW864_15135 [Spirochaetes bacterium]|nr:hypothetical protein [Spirochaetota bacterium]
MKTEKILKPGQPGTKKLTEKFGDDLVCIRYRYDEISKKRITTVEIIVDNKIRNTKPKRIPPNKIISIRINYNDMYLRKLVKSAGGKWNSIEKVWELTYRQIVELGLENKVIDYK